MGWEDDHAKRVAVFPPDVREAHKHSIRHRDEIMGSTHCGCFYCCAMFPARDIADWTDDGDTALCPKCGIDSVIGDRSGFPVSVEFLASMKTHWF
jgi:hypothetical protein